MVLLNFPISLKNNLGVYKVQNTFYLQIVDS